MKRGPKPQSDSAKVLKGTFRPGRANPVEVIDVPDEIQIECPEWIRSEAREVWGRVVPIIHSKGRADDAHFDLICTYCLIAGRQIALAKEGQYLPQTDRKELRLLGETLRLTSGERGPVIANNPFSGNGKR